MSPSNPTRGELRSRLTGVLDPTTATRLVDEFDRDRQVAAVLALVDELAEISPKVARAAIEAMPELRARAGLGEVSNWLDLCVALAETSGATALRFAKESPRLLALLDGHGLRVRMLGLALECAERDANVSLEFLRASPELARVLGQEDLTRWTEIGFELTDRNYVLGLEFFRESPSIAEAVPLDEIRNWIGFGLRLLSSNQFGKTDYLATLEFLRMSPALLNTVADMDTRRLLIQLGATAAVRQPQIAVEFLAETPALLQRVEHPDWQRRMLQYAQFVVEQDAVCAQEYLRRCPEVVERLGYDDAARRAFETWFKGGMEILAYSPEGARAYFALETRQAMSALEEAHSGVPLRQVARTLKWFVQALCGRDIAVQELPDGEPSKKQTARARVSADGRTLFLPSIVRRHAERQDNVRAYLVMVAHEAGHLEFGTYDLRLDHLDDWIRAVNRRYGHEEGPAPVSLADVFAKYPQPGIIRDLWTILEDVRVEQRLRLEYPGLSHDLEAVTREAVTTRSLSQGKSVREMILEGLLIRSASVPDVSMPEPLREPLAEVWARCTPVLEPASTAADALRIADSVYVLLEDLVGAAQSATEPGRSTSEEAARRATGGPQASEAMSTDYRPIDNWSFRGGMHPECIGRGDADVASNEPQDRTDAHTEDQAGRTRGADPTQAGLRVAMSERDLAAQGAESAPHAGADEQTQIADPRRTKWEPPPAEPERFLYDEWDGMLRDYRAKWCRVVERRQPLQNHEYAAEILGRHGPAIRLLRRYFESIRPPALRVVHGVTDGDEIDLDAVVALHADAAAGADPSDRVYIRRERRERDVAVAFLVDLSGSTGRRIDADGLRVIDVEKAGLVLLCEALEAVGDQFAIFGFSGMGRRQVEMTVLKEFTATNCAEAIARIGAVEPQHQNRDGAAIRYAARALAATDARVKLLVLISDGKPLDDGYADEYALEDTKMALREVVTQGIDPFCITVDRDAEAYVRRMYGDVRYLVIDRVESLPERLPRVYHRLTT